ncbi:hypothetical protein [Sphingomonas melonis]|uniref:Uncharacterized protein n=1 Tax=Sphingomonas melonis TaxID=152682 RepID=A0A7Y9FLN5_9SPHN|nr:hypothetical protein [Sphingomonas melonis]NYD89167.1 hypothetical protein [Sphingomonas melonis]
MLRSLLIATVALATPAVAAHPDTPEIQLETALAGRVAGKATNCITLSGVNSTQIINGKAIIYRAGSRLYLNEPRSGAESLRDDDILFTRTFGSHLCSIDTVRLIDRGSRVPRGFVSLGRFVPYTKAKNPA